MKKIAAIVVILGFVSPVAVADLYKWVGKDGKITYSDTPPPEDAKKVERKRLNDRVTESDQLPFAAQAAAKKYPVTLYSTDCGNPCKNGIALLAKRGVPYALKNPETNLADGKELKKLIGALEVPALQVGKDKGIKGFNEAAWNAALDAAGYPRSAGAAKASNLAKESKDAAPDVKKKSDDAQKGGPDSAQGGGGKSNTGGATPKGPAFTNKAEPNARSGPYNEPELPAAAKNNTPSGQNQLSEDPVKRQAEINRMEGK
ncbi:MAG: glutaredoxin family protein [Burkholderiales bacterium]